MKKLLFSLALAAAVGQYAQAQTADSTTDPGYSATAGKAPVSPAVKAARQLTTMQKKLDLTQDQVIKLRMILLNLNVSLDSLRSNPSGDKKSDNKTRRALTQDADWKTYALLTTDQQVLYTKWKQEQQEKRKMNRAAHKGVAPATTPSSSPTPATAPASSPAN
jgi:Spy/CpxP family protein refolding chaperone